MTLELTDQIQENDQQAVYRGLLDYNLARIEDQHPQELGVYVRNESGEITAGLIGNTHGNWLTVKYLWVSESLRGQRIGSELLEAAEQAARERGCKYSFLDTFGFQAPEFYQKHGYHVVFTLEEYPISGKRYYFTKEL